MTIQNKKQWRNLCAKARRGNANAQWAVGRYYKEGIFDKSGAMIVKSQPHRAVHWYTLSAQQGHENAQIDLGNLLSTGDGVERDIEKAIYWTKQALKNGSPLAAYNLGTIYRDLKKPATAFRWYIRAAEMGALDSYLQIGLCYLFGFGTKTNFEFALKSFQNIINGDPSESCERDKENAYFWIGILHLLGIGGAKKSVAKARELFESADKDLDHEQANEILNIIGKTKYILT